MKLINKYYSITAGWSKMGIIALLFIFFAQFSAYGMHEIIISGTVRDARTKEPLPASSVLVIQEKTTVTTGADGRFVVKVQSPVVTLRVTAFGFVAREIPLQGRASLDILLYSEAFSELPATASTQTLSHEAIYPNTLAMSPDEVIAHQFAGKVRGIQRSGAAGVGAAIFLRGLNSLNINAQPLYVVDGVIREQLYDVQSIHQGFFANPLSGIELSDIASVTVLSDGNSIYGSKGANGVILITTKRGNSQVTKINLNISTGMTLSPTTIPVMKADDYRIYASEILGSAGFSNSDILLLPYLNDDPARSTYKQYHNETDWTKQVYQNGTTSNYAINVNGGDDKALYYFSLGYAQLDEVVQRSDFQRYNMRLNADVKLADNLTAGINIGFSRIDRVLIDDGVNDFTAPAWISKIKSPFLSPYNFTFLGDQTTEFAFADIFNVGNPGAILKHSINTVKQNGFNVGIVPKFRISPELTLVEHFDYYLNKVNEDYYRPYLYSAPIFIQGIGESENARMSQVMRNNTIFSDTRLEYEKQLHPDHHLKAVMGSRWIYNNFESDYVEGHNSRSNSSINLRGSFRNLVTDGVNSLTRSISNYAGADWTFAQRYLINASVSIDGSSRFGRETVGGMRLFGSTWGVFPSVNGAWLISSEEFMQNIPSVSLLKLKLGAGVTGNDDIPDYQNKAYFGAVKLQGVASGLVLTQLENPQIQWETTARSTAGIDLGLLNDRITLSMDVYSARTSNLLVMKSLQDVAGLEYYWKNEGSLSNRGFESSVQFRVLNAKSLQWELGLSAGHYSNKVVDLPNGSFITKVFGGEVLTEVGQPAGVFYGYKTNGVFATEAAAKAADLKMRVENGSYRTFGAGDIIFEDIMKDGIIDEKDRQIIGNPNPDLYGAINSRLTFGNLSLDAVITFSYGNDVYNYPRHLLESADGFNNQSLAVLNRWKADGQVTQQPRAQYGDPMGNARFSDRWIEDGSFARLKTLAISYNIPLRSTFPEGLSIWVSGENLFTWTNYLGTEPEVYSGNAVLFQGVDAGLLPTAKRFALGFRISL